MSVVNNNLLLTADAGVAPSAYQVSRSLRFNSADSAYLSRTPSVAGNRTTWTWSGWVKRSALGAAQVLFKAGTVNLTDDSLVFDPANTLQAYTFAAPNVYTSRLITTQVFRDCSAWYHILWAWDTNNATAAQRSRLYVNGVQISSFGTATYPTSGRTVSFNNNVGHSIGSNNPNSNSGFLSGYLADVHFIDGQALTPSSFTETNATTGQLVPKAYTGTYGTNGFRLNFSDNSAATAATLGADSSGNGNNWTPNNLSVANSFLGGNNGTLVNGPTYSSANGGSIVFDGTNDYAGTTINSGLSGSFTFCCFVNVNSITANGAILASQFSTNYWAFLGFNPSNQLTFALFDNTNNPIAISSTNVTPGTWCYITGVRNTVTDTVSIFFNGTSTGSSIDSTTSVPAYSAFNVGGQTNVAGRYANCKVAIAQIYDRALSASEITQNYNALVGRFGGTSTGSIVTDGMVLNLDAGNTASYPGTGTTWTDISTRTNPGIDSLTDTPTSYGTDTGTGAEVRGNYATLNAAYQGKPATVTITNGNLETAMSSNIPFGVPGTICFPSTGKWYAEVVMTAISGQYAWVGITDLSQRTTISQVPGFYSQDYAYANGALKLNNSSSASYGATWTTNDVIGIAVDCDAATIVFYKNGSSQGIAYSGLTSLSTKTFCFGSGALSITLICNFGQRPFAYAAPSGFKALCDTNLPTPTIAKGSSVFDTVLYTGTGAALTPTSSLAFSPDLVWIKERSDVYWHNLFDTIRGVLKRIASNSTVAESTPAASLTSFDSAGFTLGADSANSGVNRINRSMVAWAWDAGSSTVTNTAGTITSQVRANPSAGFSVVSWTGTGASGGTIGHGLNVVPEFIFAKARTVVVGWPVYHKSLPNLSSLLVLQTTDATVTSANYWGSTAFTSNVFNASPSNISGGNWLGADMVAYCFAAVTGYSSFGSYTGNGSADGTFVYLGFRPAFLMMKRTNSTGNWVMLDSKRAGYNVDNDPQYANLFTSDGTTDLLDITSNGFKLRTTNADCNASGGTYIYAAFAENPFQYARAR